MNDDEASSPSRRRLLKSLTLVPIAAVGVSGCAQESDEPAAETGTAAGEYQATFFNAAEWPFVLAACDRLIPADTIGPGALQAGVPEFIDRHMQTPYASGDIWYMQGPFVEAAPQFGYQGRLAVKDILRVGIKGIDAHCQKEFRRQTIRAARTRRAGDAVEGAEAGKLELENISAREFFNQLLNETRMVTSAIPNTAATKTCLHGR